eukprot:TRINITY_DN63866_c0_g1_i1.p1 TRINITY_DN63866_c0_g1~~TRINITY_DN63866_c0_g1_i1.p1  ORF type:complete len:158 (-),score=21.88 TRINITY_DN63866_c0_g1_i1:69-542(-)
MIYNKCSQKWVEEVEIIYMFIFFLMIRRPPRSTQGVSSAASDVYKRQLQDPSLEIEPLGEDKTIAGIPSPQDEVSESLFFSLKDKLACRPSFLLLLTLFESEFLSLRKILFISHVPVSYTHLRAHETSLHLVCRLLLEKKKNQQTQKKLTNQIKQSS